MKNYSRIIVFSLLLVSVCLGLSPTQTSLGADGTTGNMECGTSTYTIGQPMTFYLTQLTVAGDYKLDFPAGVATDISWSQGVAQTTMTFVVTLEAPSTGNTALIELEKQSAGTVIDSVLLSVTDSTTIFPDELIIGLGITVMVISIIVGIAVGMRIKRS